MNQLSQTVLDQLFHAARTPNLFLDQPIDDQLLFKVWETLRWAPTSANCSPLRVQFVKSPAAKAKLLTCVDPGNAKKVQSAPVTAILGMDMRFHDKLKQLFPHTDAKAWFEGQDEKIATTAFRNSSLQGAYFMLAARAMGLDCGPMSGFDHKAIDAAFFAGTHVRSNFLCNLGYGDPASVFARSPRLEFHEACSIV